MIKNPDILEKFERELIKKENLSFKQALAIFEAMWKEGEYQIAAQAVDGFKNDLPKDAVVTFLLLHISVAFSHLGCSYPHFLH